MATPYELRSASVPEYDHKGGVRVSRRYIVDLPASLIPKDGSLVGLPAVNESHPFIPNARVDAILTSEVEGKKDWSYVDILYSNDRAFGFSQTPINPTEPTYRSWGISFTTVEVVIPVAKKVSRSVPSPTGGAPVVQEAFAYGPDYVFTYFETRPIIARQVVLPGIGPEIWGPIMDQNNKLHLIGGRIWRFEAGDIVETSSGVWETTYTWWGDNGSSSASLTNSSPPQNSDIIYPPGFGTYFRSPHGVWQVINPTVATPLGYPFFVQVFPYDYDLGGASTLPGTPV